MSSSSGHGQPPRDEPEAAAVLRQMVEAFSAGEHERAMRWVADDVVDHAALPGAAPGAEGWRAKWAFVRRTFDEFSITCHQYVADGDTVVGRHTVRGRQIGDVLGIPAAGRRFEVLALEMARVRDGRIVEHWMINDQGAMRAQLSGEAAGG